MYTDPSGHIFFLIPVLQVMMQVYAYANMAMSGLQVMQGITTGNMEMAECHLHERKPPDQFNEHTADVVDILSLQQPNAGHGQRQIELRQLAGRRPIFAISRWLKNQTRNPEPGTRNWEPATPSPPGVGPGKSS